MTLSCLEFESISGNNLNVYQRGSSLANPDGTLVYATKTDEHSAGATVQNCYTLNKTPLQDFMRDLYNFAGLDEFTNYQQWSDELEEWNSDADLYGVLSEPAAIDEILDKKMQDYMIDSWLDQNSQKVVISAVSAWKNASRTLEEGKDFTNLKTDKDDSRRVSRAYIQNGKRFQAESDEMHLYSKNTGFTDIKSETDDFYGKPKVKDLGMSPTISAASAQITTARYVQRFSRTPSIIEFTMPERKVGDLNLSSIVDIVSRDSQMPDGTYFAARSRAQIIRMQQPSLNKIGREYNIRAMTYVPLIASGPNKELTIRLTGTIFDENLYSRAGAPNVPVNVTFVFDGCVIGSSSFRIPAVRAGSFPAGSRVRIFCLNNVKWSAIGGDSSGMVANLVSPNQNAGSSYIVYERSPTQGGVCYESDGVTTEIYLNYSTPDYECRAQMFAPGGGGGSSAAFAHLADGESFFVNALCLFPGGNGIPSGRGGYVRGSRDYSAVDGRFESMGQKLFLSDGRVDNRDNFVTATSTVISESSFSGDGGSSESYSSVNGFSVDWGWSFATQSKRSDGSNGGASIKGSSVTVYNKESAKMTNGKSDPFTEVTS